MFRSSTIIRELALNLAKIIFMLKHSVKLSLIYYAVVWKNAREWHVADDGRRPKHVGAIFICILT
jgi:hypothetical protein